MTPEVQQFIGLILGCLASAIMWIYIVILILKNIEKNQRKDNEFFESLGKK